MALSVYYVSEIRHALVAALVVAIETAQASEGANTDHLRGIVTMAKATAANFGIPWHAVCYDARQALGGLLDAVPCEILEAQR